MSDKKNLKILFVTSEAAPYIKSGGLGDVAGTLPKEIKKQGIDIRVVLPKYQNIDYSKINDLSLITSFKMNFGWREQGADIYGFTDEIPFYLMENHYYFDRDNIYGYDDDYERFAFFSKASLELLYNIDFQPDIIHFNDWQTGLGSVYLNHHYKSFAFYKNIKTIYTIHNLQYQGIFGKHILSDIGLDDGYFVNDKLEYYGNVSLMKAGIVYSDAISTVSKTYAKEIQTPAYAYGMDGVLRSRKEDLYGIINGIDYTQSNPATDKTIYANFSHENIEGKYENKRLLREELGLQNDDAPVIGIVSRMVDQKGFDLISLAMDEIISKGAQIAAVGTGDKRYENMFHHYAWKYPGKVSATMKFDVKLAQKIYAGSDMFLMPSFFEPCGLGQMFAMRYGSVPIVRNTGGLSDTVKPYDFETKTGNGFIFNNYDAYGMMWAVKEALNIYFNHKEDWGIIVKNCLLSNFSWDESSKKYIELYNKVL